jgi:hypothetical protein
MKNKAKYNPTDFEKALDALFLQMFPQYHRFFNIVTMRRSYSDDAPLIWAMNQGKIPEICEIYFLGDYMCEVNNSMYPAQIELLITNCLIQYRTGLEKNAGVTK